MPPQLRMKRRDCVRQISNHGQLAGPHAVNLRRVDLKVDDLRLRRKPRRLAGYSIVEPRAEYQQQISLIERCIRSPRPVHPTMPR